VDGRVTLPDLRPGLYEVDVQYTGPGAGARAFTMLQNNFSAAVDANGYVALDPGASSQRVPVRVDTTGSVALATLDMPAGEEALTQFHGCAAQRVEVPRGADTLQVYGLPAPPYHRPGGGEIR
jgi:hypothetical protein